MSNEEKDENKEKKLSLRERMKDKKEKAKIELMLYGIFFIAVIIFTRVLGSTAKNIDNSGEQAKSFISSIQDNYEYDLLLTVDNDNYEYYGKVLGNNSMLSVRDGSSETKYYLMNKKYYILDEGNYILTDEQEVYPYIDYRYLSIDNIKQYLEMATRDNDTYTVRIADILLNSESEESIVINIQEGDKNIVIDYTNLFKLIDQNKEKVVVNITYSNIDKIISLDE